MELKIKRGEIMETKHCYKCDKTKDIKEFDKDKSKKGGLANKCKTCKKEYMVEYYKENKESMIAQQKINGIEYRKTHKECLALKQKEYNQNNKVMVALKSKKYRLKNKERIIIRSKKYYQKNRETLLAYCKRYVHANKEIVAVKAKKYRSLNKESIAIKKSIYAKEHLDEYRARNEKRRSLKENLPCTLTNEQWESIKAHFNNRCCYCNKEKPLTQEHFIPVTKGGEYTINNIIPSCQSCNSSKGNRPFTIWYKAYKSYSKKREKIILKFLGYDDEYQQLQIN